MNHNNPYHITDTSVTHDILKSKTDRKYQTNQTINRISHRLHKCYCILNLKAKNWKGKFDKLIPFLDDRLHK